MSAKHTPGPWATNPFMARVDCAAFSQKGGLLPICEMLWPTDERSEAETLANARLIAAAPDLLDALQGLLSFAEDSETKALVGDEGCLWPVEEARAAIAKATRLD